MTPPETQTDGALLTEFNATASQAAFTELVRRHAPMVHGVSLRVLGDHHEAQDVTQATFVTLARKAGSLRHHDSIGGWLHTVAWRLAQDARVSRQRRQQRQEHAMAEAAIGGPAAPRPFPAEVQAFRAELDAGIEELPERYRRPLVLFHLQSRSLEETGRLLGLNPNTLRTRLGRARELLRKKLVARGISLGSVGALTALLSAESGAAVLPATFVASTVGAATGTTAVSASVATLTQGALHMLSIAKVKTVSLLAAACLVTTGAGWIAFAQLSPGAPAAPAAPVASGGRQPALPAAPPTGAGAIQPAAQEPWSISVRPIQAQFAVNEPLRFLVGFRNQTADELTLEALSYLGSQTVGRYNVQFRNRQNGLTWTPWVNPGLPQPGAPAAFQSHAVKPGATLELSYTPNAQFAQIRNGVRETAAHLPVGEYELLLEVQWAGITHQPAPAPFAVVAAQPVEPLGREDSATILEQARAALTATLTRYAASGGQLPGNNSYGALRAENFQVTIEPQGKVHVVQFVSELANTDSVLTWSVTVSEAGVDPNFGMRGFVVQSKRPAPVAPVAPVP